MALPLLLSVSWPCLQSHQKRGLKVLASSNFVSDFHWLADHLLEVQCIYGLKKTALYLSVNVFSTKVLIGTLFLRLGPPFYEVIRATRRSNRLLCKGSTFISQLL